MAKFFREEEIEDFKQSFHLHARQSKRDNDRVLALKSVEELRETMFCLGMSPTLHELRQYLGGNGGKLVFAEFLEVMHKAKETEQIPDDILDGFRAQDKSKKGKLPAKDIRYMLRKFDGMTTQEIDRLFRDARVNVNGDIDYVNFVNAICNAPVSSDNHRPPSSNADRPISVIRPGNVTRGRAPPIPTNYNGNFNFPNGEPVPDY